MLKRIAAMLLVALTVSLQGCVSATGGGLTSYADNYKGYEFFYPNGWVPVKVSGSADVVFHDIINATENVSVVVSPVAEGKTLEDFGPPEELGQKLSESITALGGEGRQVELIDAKVTQSSKGITYYRLEYGVESPNGDDRHDLASVVIRRNQLFTFDASTQAARWPRMENLLRQSVESFSVY